MTCLIYMHKQNQKLIKHFIISSALKANVSWNFNLLSEPIFNAIASGYIFYVTIFASSHENELLSFRIGR